MKTVTIPTCANPFVVILNGIKYTFPAGETVEVSDEIAEVIMQHAEWHANHKYTPEGGSGCGCNGGLEVYEVSSPDEIAADAPDGFYVVPKKGSGESGGSSAEPFVMTIKANPNYEVQSVEGTIAELQAAHEAKRSIAIYLDCGAFTCIITEIFFGFGSGFAAYARTGNTALSLRVSGNSASGTDVINIERVDISHEFYINLGQDENGYVIDRSFDEIVTAVKNNIKLVLATYMAVEGMTLRSRTDVYSALITDPIEGSQIVFNFPHSTLMDNDTLKLQVSGVVITPTGVTQLTIE